jgi:hypothetical protein
MSPMKDCECRRYTIDEVIELLECGREWEKFESTLEDWEVAKNPGKLADRLLEALDNGEVIIHFDRKELNWVVDALFAFHRFRGYSYPAEYWANRETGRCIEKDCCND